MLSRSRNNAETATAAFRSYLLILALIGLEEVALGQNNVGTCLQRLNGYWIHCPDPGT